MSLQSIVHLRQLRKRAKALRTHALIVWNMRRDLLSAEESSTFRASIDALGPLRKSRDADALLAGVKATETLCSSIEPPRALPILREWTETLVVAFGVAMAFRAYCFQPFKIPTGSMQPTLFGHHSEYCERPQWYDFLPFKPITWLFTGRWYTEVIAPESGSASLYTDRAKAPGYIFIRAAGHDFKVPQDAYERGEIRFGSHADAGLADAGGGHTALTSGFVRAGARIWSGYSIAGDHVFVNRFKWYFRPPKRGEIIVFSTDDNPHLTQGEFYIKRLAGLPGETLSMDPPYLTVNGTRVTAPDTVLRVSEKRPAETRGYTYLGYRFIGQPSFFSPIRSDYSPAFLGVPGQSVQLGSEDYFPLGDNTLNSYDARYWGPVKRNRLIGNASCVYWPLSVRWGNVD